MNSVLTFVQRQWFLAGLAILIPGGLLLGRELGVETVNRTIAVIPPRGMTAIILFVMAWTLNTKNLGASFRRPGPVMWACLVNAGLLPVLALAFRPLQTSADFEIGLMIAASVPCTMAAASVWTRKAGGNDAVSLLVTIVTNGLCFLITPMWVYLGTGRNLPLELGTMIQRLFWAVILPMACGQLLRINRRLGELATTKKVQLSALAQGLILVVVFVAACKAGTTLSTGDASPDGGAVARVWLSCIALHLLALTTAYHAARWMRFDQRDCIGVAFASSQKTLPVGIVMAELVSLTAPFAGFPMLMFHASQLFIDTIIAARFAAVSRGQTVTEG